MKRKKEILIIIIILFITLILILIPVFSELNDKESDVVKTNSKTNAITLKIEGEINYISPSINDGLVTNSFEITVPYGISFGELSSKINVYYTRYSIIPSNYTKRYYENETITIESSYRAPQNTISKDGVDDKGSVSSGLININTASAEELKTLYGIGDARALAIINYRNTKLIETYDELKKIIGVSDEVIEIIREKTIL